jgi:hypothetical protein
MMDQVYELCILRGFLVKFFSMFNKKLNSSVFAPGAVNGPAGFVFFAVALPVSSKLRPSVRSCASQRQLEVVHVS